MKTFANFACYSFLFSLFILVTAGCVTDKVKGYPDAEMISSNDPIVLNDMERRKQERELEKDHSGNEVRIAGLGEFKVKDLTSYKLASTVPKKPAEILAKADFLYENAKYNDAENAYKEYLTMVENGGTLELIAHVHHRLGCIFKRRMCYAEAAAEFQIAITKSPNNAEYLFDYAQLHYTMKDYQAANTLFTKVLALQPDYPEVSLFIQKCRINGNGAAPAQTLTQSPQTRVQSDPNMGQTAEKGQTTDLVNGSSTSSQALIPVVSQVQNDSIQNNSVPANTAFTVNTPEPAKQPQAGTKGTTVSNVLTSVFNGGSLGYVPGQSSQIPVVQNDNSDEIFFEENEPQEATPTDLGNPVESISGSLGEITLKSMHPVQRPVLGDGTDHEKLPSQLLIPALNRYLSNSDSVKESSIIPESPDALANHTETDNLGMSETVFVGNMNRNGSVVTEQPLISADMTTPDVTRESVSTDRLVYDPQELFCIRVVEAPVSGVPSRENSAFPEIPSVSLITTAPLQPAAVAWNFVPNTTEFMNSETGETVDFSDPECGFTSTFPDSYRDIGTMSSNMTSVNTAVGYSDSNGNTVVYVDRPEVSDRVPVSAPDYRVVAAPGYWNNNTMDNVITGKDPAVTYSGNWGYSAGENEGFASSGNGITGSVPASGFPVISQSEPVQTDGLAFSDSMMTIPADSPLIAGNSADSGYHLVAAGTDNRPRRSASESIQEAIKAGAKVTELDASEYRKALREAGTQAAATKNQVTQTMK